MRLIIADDQTLFRDMLAEHLSKDSDIEIVASASDGDSAVKLCTIHVPDLVLLDIQMPVLSGLEALKILKATQPDVKVVLLTTFECFDHMSCALQNGADGYLVKDIKPEALITALKCIHNDLAVFHKSTFANVQVLRPMAPQGIQKIEIGHMTFDAIDIAIMRHIVEGKTNREIGLSLCYSEGTIKNRISKLLSVTNLSDRTEISVFALKHQLV